MAEALGIAASTLAVSQFVDRVANYAKSASNASNEAKAWAAEVKALDGVRSSLSKLRRVLGEDELGLDGTLLMRHVDDCDRALSRFNTMPRRANNNPEIPTKLTALGRRKHRATELISELSRHKKTLETAMLNPLSRRTPRPPRDNTEGSTNVTQHHAIGLRGLRRREVPGTVNDVPVNAVPDYGSSVDTISQGFARKHGLKIQAADKMSIKLPGGGVAKSVGCVVGDFKFQGESQTYTRHFRVLGKCAFDMVLGKAFLEQTKTLTDFCYRIVERFRPCIQKGGRFFLLDESPEDRIRCTVNGASASAFPDTGSDLMLVSGDFARRNKLAIRRGRKYQRQVELADGSFIRTDGMVLGAELEFDAPPVSSPRVVELDQYLEYDHGLTVLLSAQRPVKATAHKALFICDLHVIEDLPCDIILSSDFIFDNHVFTRFKHLFFSELPILPTHHPSPHPPASDAKMRPDDCLFFMQLRSPRKRTLRIFSRSRQRPPTPPLPDDGNAIPLQDSPSWEELWEAEEARRNRMQLRIASMPEPLKSAEQRAEDQRRADWDRSHPRPRPLTHLPLILPPMGSSLGLVRLELLAATPSIAVPPPPQSPAASPTAAPWQAPHAA